MFIPFVLSRVIRCHTNVNFNTNRKTAKFGGYKPFAPTVCAHIGQYRPNCQEVYTSKPNLIAAEP